MSDSNNVININNEINWTKVVKKEARGIDDADFGEVQEIVLHYIFTEKGLVNKEKFYLPTDLVAGFDGEKLRFNISEEEAKEKFQRETSPSADEYAIYKRKIISTDIDTDKHHNNENIAGLNPDISPSEEVKDANQVKQETHNNTEGLPSQNKKFNIKSKVEDREAEERSSREAEDKAKQEAERKAQSIQDKAKQEAERRAQSIAQQAEDKAKQEAERRAQSIAQQAEDKAKQEAERRFKEIIQQAEDKAKQEAERRFKEIIQQAEDKAKQEDEVKKELSQEKSRYFETNDINEINVFFNPFMIGINLWQNYSLLCMNMTKELLSNTRRMTKDFENTVRRIRQNTAV
jgi:hypothetical protein